MSDKSARLSIDVAPALRTRVKVAAARQGKSLRDYCLEAIQRRLDEEAPAEDSNWAQLSARAFARDWSSEEDSVYDDLS